MHETGPHRPIRADAASTSTDPESPLEGGAPGVSRWTPTNESVSRFGVFYHVHQAPQSFPDKKAPSKLTQESNSFRKEWVPELVQANLIRAPPHVKAWIRTCSGSL